MNQIAFIYGEILVYWSSIVMALAVLTGVLFFWAAYVRCSGHLTGAAAVCPLAVILSLLLARLIHWYFSPDSYESLMVAMTDFSRSGYALSGAFFGCLLAAGVLRLLKIVKKLPLTLDCMSIGGCAAITVGRLSSFFTAENRGEILSGVTHLPWVYPVVNPTSGALEYRIATFLFQSIIAGCVLILLLLVYWRDSDKRKHQDGDVVLLFMLLYCASQIVLDSMRYDSLRLRSNGFISIVQVFCALALLLIFVVFSVRLRKKSCLVAWLIFAACMGGAAYMEYYVQRHGNQALFAYSVMSGCLGMIVVLGSVLWHLTGTKVTTGKRYKGKFSKR